MRDERQRSAADPTSFRHPPPGSIREQLTALPTPVWVLFGGTFVNRFGTFVMPLLAIYLTRHGYSVVQAGLAVGAYGAGHLVASMLGGHLADRIGRRNTIALSMFASAAAMLTLSQARGYTAIVALTAVAGCAAELYRPASHALLGDLVSPEQRVLAFGMYRFAVNLGFAAGPATAGLLADRSFFLVFAGDAITSLAYGFIAIAALPHGLRSFKGGEPSTAALRSVAQNRRYLWFLAATLLTAMIDYQMTSTFALHVKAQGFSSATYGLLISLNGAMIVLFEILITTRTQLFRPQPVIALGYALNGIGFALTGLAHTIPALAATVVIWTIGEMISSPMAGAYATQLAPERYRGRYMGFLVLMWSFGMVFGPTLGTMLFAHHPAVLWPSCAVVGLIAAALTLKGE